MRVAVGAPVVSLLVAVAAAPLRQRYESVDNPLDLRNLGGVPQVVSNLALAVTFAAGLVALLSLVGLVAWALGHPATIGWAAGLSLAVLPLAIGAAILRYRLDDLDRIISRTVGYGLLTLLLGGAYAGLVLGLGQLVGRSSPLLVAGATLAVASAFQPARRRVQDLVDRRFNRRRYDATRTIEGFSARLRDEVDLDTLTAELMGVVEETMQPTSASLWLRPRG